MAARGTAGWARAMDSASIVAAAVCSLSADIDDSTQYATVYSGTGRPVATLHRRRISDPRTAPRWQAFDTEGRKLRDWFLLRSYDGLLRDLERTLARKAVRS